MEWLIAFSDGDRFAWWDVWTRPGFRPVSACRYDAAADCWLFYDVKIGGTRVTVERGDAAEEMLGRLMATSRIVRFVGRAHQRIVPAAWGCAGAMAHLLGVSGAFTPWRLFRHLLANGGQEWRFVEAWPPCDIQ